ncbi:MAG TPA: diaminopimelate decarboxylase [Terriglobia bacterium]|nr:diaminopimelate decarboxylase [Terriglobia bacterium]
MNSTPNQYLEYRPSGLFCESVRLESAAERFGTPLYIYSQAAILENFRAFQQGLAGVPSLVCYSVKANSSLSILDMLREAGSGFDIVSGGELARVLKIKADPWQVVFSGVGKTQAEVDSGLGAGLLAFNVESAGELELIAARARHLHRRAPVSIRVNPDVEAETHPYISTGQTIHKFGVPKEDAIALYKRAAAMPEIEVRGIACHIGSQILDVEPFWEAFDEIRGLADALRADGVALEYLDLGGGFGIRYADEIPLEIGRLAEGLKERIQTTPYRIVVEPGRSIVGSAGLLLTRVLYIKRNPAKNFIVVDSGMNDLVRPALYGSFHEIVPLRQPTDASFCADVVGPLCETGDFLAQGRQMPEVQPGDLLAILTAGAYGYALASNYNTRPRPAEIMVHGDHAKLIRPREAVEELFAREFY